MSTIEDADHPPVQDWATDFDHTRPRLRRQPVPDLGRAPRVGLPRRPQRALRRRLAPDLSRRRLRHRLRHRALHVAQRRDVAVPAARARWRPPGIAPPISSDPPFHKGARRLLLPAFAPRAIDQLEDSTRAYCEELIAAMGDRDVVDAAQDYAQHIPVRVIANMLGFPEDDADRFRGFVNHVIENVALPLEKRAEGMMVLFEYLRVQVEDHVANPRDDLTSYLLESEMDGQPLEPAHVVGTMALLLIAGIDTTWSAIGASICHLATTPADRERLVAEPDLLPTAMEELLRAYAPVTMARLVRDDFDFNGCPMRADDWVLLPFPSANRDPEAFEDADQVIIDREVNRHAAFGLGIHRCAGSHLARMELRVALEVWLEHFPTFALAEPDAVRWSGGQVRGPRVLPIKVG